jgi:hypothetical protein
MPPTVRKTVQSLHVIVAVGWLGLTFGDVTLGVTAVVTDTPSVQHAMFRALGTIADVLLLPIAWVAYATGILMALGTRWGLVRHKWVLTKFLLTTLTVALTTFSLVPGLKTMRDTVNATPADELVPMSTADVSGLVSAAVVSTTCYTICVVLSIFKPWGRTRWGAATTKPVAAPTG